MKISRFDISKQEKNGINYWRLYVPPYLDPQGKGGYRYYRTRTEADRKRAELIATTRTEAKLLVLSNAQERDAQRAYELLASEGLTMSLSDAIARALPLLSSEGCHITVDSLCADFAALKEATWAKKTAASFRFASRLFLERFSGTHLSELTARDMEAWLNARFPSAVYRSNIIRTLRPAFSWAVRQDYLHASPFDKLEAVRLVKHRDGIDILTPTEAARLMQTAPHDCRAAYALLLFAGVRPEELKRLTWGNIRDGYIHITPSIAKTAQVRNIAIEPTLAAWLKTCPHGEPEDTITPTNWKRKDQQTRREAGIANRQDVCRHSYASYWLAVHQDANALKQNMGHSRSSDTLFAHYRAAATKASARAFWGILPCNV